MARLRRFHAAIEGRMHQSKYVWDVLDHRSSQIRLFADLGERSQVV
jgi:hypothetical protein